MTIAIAQKVTLDGNFFRKDPGKTLRHNVRDMLDALAEEMERTARAGIAPHSDTGWTHDHTFGYTRSALTGKRWETWAAVGVVTAGMSERDSIRSMAAASSIERRFHPFRRTKDMVYRSRAILTADLAEGIS